MQISDPVTFRPTNHEEAVAWVRSLKDHGKVPLLSVDSILTAGWADNGWREDVDYDRVLRNLIRDMEFLMKVHRLNGKARVKTSHHIPPPVLDHRVFKWHLKCHECGEYYHHGRISSTYCCQRCKYADCK